MVNCGGPGCTNRADKNFIWQHIQNPKNLKENFNLIIFSLFHLKWPRIGFYSPTYKKELFFSSKTHISTSFAQDKYDLLVTNINIFQ